MQQITKPRPWTARVLSIVVATAASATVFGGFASAASATPSIVAHPASASSCSAEFQELRTLQAELRWAAGSEKSSLIREIMDLRVQMREDGCF